MGGSAPLQGNNRIVVTEPRYYGYNYWDPKIPEYRAALLRPDDEFERDRIAKELAIKWLRENPDQWWFLIQAKFRLGMDSVPSGRYARFIAADNALQLGARSRLIRLGLFSNVMEFPAVQTFWLDTAFGRRPLRSDDVNLFWICSLSVSN